jgi:hypothetical protein
VNRRSALRVALGSAALLLLGRGRPGATSSSEPAPAGEISGTALGAGRNPAAAPSPLDGLTVLLLPRSAALLDGLEKLRRQSRDSLAAYRSAIPGMRRLVEAAVADFKSSGQADSIRQAAIDDRGRFALPEIPPGDWILIGYRSVHVDRASRDTEKESGTFLPGNRLVAYDLVSVWLRPLAVEPGRAQVVEITDRNVWFEGVAEQMAARDRTPITGGRRRSAH